jgi:serine/threonine protein kinase
VENKTSPISDTDANFPSFYHSLSFAILSASRGFSFVYLVQDVASGRFYALKKIRCPFGSEGVQDAMKEAEMYRTFQHENVIKMVVCEEGESAYPFHLTTNCLDNGCTILNETTDSVG